MADNLDDCEFWLPPQFLTDDDFLMGFQNTKIEGNKFSYEMKSNSGLSSPVESVEFSTEIESDEDDYITGLTQKMAHSTLEENAFGYEKNKGLDFSGSPKSPLCKQGFRSNSHNQSQVPSHAVLNQAEWDVLCAAAGEVARLKMVEESALFHSSRNVSSRKLSPPENNLGFPPNQNHFAYQQLQAARFEQLKRQQQILHQQKAAMAGCGHMYQPNMNHQQAAAAQGRRPVAGLPISAWPTLQQSQQQQQPQPPSQSSSAMRAVFLGNPGVKRECAGTGVFLPRRIGTPTETRKSKPACATVLLPERVVHSLNLNLEKIDSQPQLLQPRFNPAFNAPDYDAALKYRKNLLLAQQRQQLLHQQHQQLLRRQTPPSPPPLPPPSQSEVVELPQEWTY